MDDVSYRRIGGIAGIAAMVLIIAGFFLPGAPPKADDPVTEFTSFLVDKRGAILAGTVLIGLGAASLLVFFSAFRGLLDTGRARQRPGPCLLRGRCGHRRHQPDRDRDLRRRGFEVAGLGDDVLNRALLDTATEVFTMAGFSVALFFIAAAAAVSASGALPRWTVPTGYAVGVIQLVSTVGIFATSGFFAAGGAFAPLAFLVAAIWIIAVSVVMIRGGGTAAGTA